MIAPTFWRFSAALRAAMLLALATAGALAQEPSGPTGADDLTRQADEAAGAVDRRNDAQAEPAAQPTVAAEFNMLELLIFGGKWLMVPIWLMLFMVVTVGIERGLALRREKVIPRGMIDGLGQLSGAGGSFDPKRAYRICQQFPSAASSVVRVMLLKCGRPHSEVEHAVAEANDREASRLYSNVRTLTLAAVVAPLMGLLGTVWGMIEAFFATASLPTGVDKATALAEGIYFALVTTFGGLAVAIPAAILAHYFEGRIQSLFRDIDDLLFTLLPQVERYEGKLRVNRAVLAEPIAEPPLPGGHSAPAPPPIAAGVVQGSGATGQGADLA